LVTREEAGAHAGVPVSAEGLWFPRGGWVQPGALAEALLFACGARLERCFNTEAKNLSEGKTVVLANAAEALRLHPLPHLRLRRVRGQVTYVPADRIDAPRAAVLRGGMVLPAVDGLCVVGATYDLEDEDPALRVESHAANLERAARILPGFVFDPQAVGGRVAFRAVTADRLPVAGRMQENVFAAFAYGSRGLLWSTLAAELIASQLEAEPLPVEGTLADALSPVRFARRAARRSAIAQS
jgi:tRNA 5-methylaminomethyl-2-thiouridine biosynthesis bifunctional protein